MTDEAHEKQDKPEDHAVYFPPKTDDEKNIRIGMRIPKCFKATENRLIVEPNENGEVPWDDAELMGRQLFRIAELHDNTLPWLIGDYIIYCDEMYGERFAQVVDGGMYTEKTIRNYVYMCRNVPPENRWPPKLLSPSHHACVASLDHESQRIALKKAHENSWSVSEFRLWLAGSVDPEKDAKAYSAQRRASFVKRGLLPEGLKEQPWVEEHRKRVLREVDTYTVPGVKTVDTCAKIANENLSILELAMGGGIRPKQEMKPEVDMDVLWTGWWAANKSRIDEEEDTEKACRTVFEDAFGLARKAFAI